MSFTEFFTDPVLRAPSWGTLLMCIASSLIGVILFFKKRVLLSESLSHATYPGVVLGVSLTGAFFPNVEGLSFFAVLIGAFCSSFLALKVIDYLHLKQKMSSDAALCFVLSLFFGIGVLGTSFMQRLLPSWTGQVQMILFGQAATMTDIHILLYGSLALLVALVFYLAFHPIRAITFDPEFSRAVGLPVRLIEKILFWMLLLSLILGIRSVGIVLMSGMMIAPAVAARQFTNSFHRMLILSALIGASSGFIGNVLSVIGTSLQSQKTLPTGPMIVLVGSLFSFFSLLFAPKKGLLFRKLRVRSYARKCLEENLLKEVWKKGPMEFEGLFDMLGVPKSRLRGTVNRLKRQGWVEKEGRVYCLTADGLQKAAHVVRLHRLWELYLADTLKLCTEKVHETAEEMEHILTPDIEQRLTTLLSNPREDPHKQPIPERGGL